MLDTSSLTTWKQRLKSGEISPVELTRLVLDSISANDSQVRAYIAVDEELALADAAACPDPREDGAPVLAGLPVSIKDNICVQGQRCSCASRYLENFVSPYSSTTANRLQAAGAISLGRLNMDEFAMGSTTENSAFHPTLNPHDHSRVPGGSSGGSAAALANLTAIATLGSDTGGSIRQPAAHCGVVGFKPTYGRVSRFGLVAFASSLDQIGPITRTVEDAALLFDVISGFDPLDTTCIDAPATTALSSLKTPVRGLRIGLPKEYFASGLDENIRKLVLDAARALEAQGNEIVEVSLPHTDDAIATYYIIAPAEASSNLARFDGVRYGHRSANNSTVTELYSNSREEGFGAEVKRRILLGTYVLSSGYYDAYYNQATRVRSLVRKDFANAFEQCDLILSPVTPTPAPLLGDAKSDPLKAYLEDVYTVSANLAGLPAISIPCGTTPAPGSGLPLPVGVQLMAPPLADELLLRAAWNLEQALRPS